MTFDLLTVLVGIMTTIMLAGIPWAYRVGERLSSIETTIKSRRAIDHADTSELLKIVRELQLKFRD